MKFSYEKLYETLENTKITKTRYTNQKINNVEIIKMMAKGNNSIPVSLVFDYISKKEGKKVIVLALDDYDEKKASEYIGWIYDTDYEFLKQDDIVQFIVSGPRCYDHKLRLLCAGIDNKKIICEPNEISAIKKIKKKVDKIFILHDMSSYQLSVEAENEIIKVLGGIKNED